MRSFAQKGQCHVVCRCCGASVDWTIGIEGCILSQSIILFLPVFRISSHHRSKIRPTLFQRCSGGRPTTHGGQQLLPSTTDTKQLQLPACCPVCFWLSGFFFSLARSFLSLVWIVIVYEVYHRHPLNKSLIGFQIQRHSASENKRCRHGECFEDRDHLPVGHRTTEGPRPGIGHGGQDDAGVPTCQQRRRPATNAV